MCVFFFLVSSIVLTVGCQTESDKTQTNDLEKKAYQMQVKGMKDLTNVNNALAEVFETVVDGQSAGEAAKKIQGILPTFEKALSASANAPNISAESAKMIEEKLSPQLIQATNRMNVSLESAKRKYEKNPEFHQALIDMGTIINDLKKAAR